MDLERRVRLRKTLIGIAAGTFAVLVGVGIYDTVSNRPPKFARVVAEDLPADVVGMFAIGDPSRGLELIGAAMPDEVRAGLVEQFDADLSDATTWTELGLDLDAPMGFGVRGIDAPVVIVSLGLSDAGKARAKLQQHAETLGLTGLSERDFGGVDGLWLVSPPVAMLFHGDRMLIVSSDAGPGIVSDTATEIATLSRRDSLAATPGFAGIRRFPGNPVLLAFANIAAVDERVLAEAKLDSGEVESLAFALTSDGRDVHFVVQTRVSPSSNYLDYLRGGDRSTAALDQVPSPVYAGVHWSVNPQYLIEILDQLDDSDGDQLRRFEREAERELGVSPREDLLTAWTGEFGALWTGAGEDRWGGLAFAGVRDSAEAEALLELLWSHTGGDEREVTDAGTVYHWGERPPVMAKLHDRRVWFGVGASRLEAVGGDEPGFRKTTKVDAIADVLASGASMVAFVDLVAVRELIRELPDSDWLEDYADVLEPLEALTMQSRVDGQSLVWTTTLHTNVDDAFYTLSERLLTDIVADTTARSSTTCFRSWSWSWTCERAWAWFGRPSPRCSCGRRGSCNRRRRGRPRRPRLDRRRSGLARAGSRDSPRSQSTPCSSPRACGWAPA